MTMKLFGVLAVAGILLGACGQSPETDSKQSGQVQTTQKTSENAASQQVTSKEKEITGELVFNPLLLGIMHYDRDTGEYERYIDDDMHHQQRVKGEDELYIDGHSMDDQYRLLRVTADSVEELHVFSPREGIFPLGVHEDKLYVSHYYYDENGEEQEERRTIAEFDLKTHELIDYTNVSGLVTDGAVDAEKVYYAVYDEATELFTIMSVPLDDKEATPIIQQTNATGDNVLTYGDMFFYEEGDTLRSDTSDYPNEPDSFIHGDSFVQFYIDADQELAVRITHLQTDVIQREENILGVRFEPGKLIVVKSEETVEIDV